MHRGGCWRPGSRGSEAEWQGKRVEGSQHGQQKGPKLPGPQVSVGAIWATQLGGSLVGRNEVQEEGGQQRRRQETVMREGREQAWGALAEARVGSSLSLGGCWEGVCFAGHDLGSQQGHAIFREDCEQRISTLWLHGHPKGFPDFLVCCLVYPVISKQHTRLSLLPSSFCTWSPVGLTLQNAMGGNTFF